MRSMWFGLTIDRSSCGPIRSHVGFGRFGHVGALNYQMRWPLVSTVTVVSDTSSIPQNDSGNMGVVVNIMVPF